MRLLTSFNRLVHSKNMSSHLVFVYGTLKKGEPNHDWLESKENGYGKFISKAKTVQKYPLVIASLYNIPFLLFSPGKGENVIGELYEVDDKMLSKLDELEDHPSFYVREMSQIQIIPEENKNVDSSNNLVQSWIYFLKGFKPSLLSQEYLIEYQSEGSHKKPYMPRHKRIPGYHARNDVLLS